MNAFVGKYSTMQVFPPEVWELIMLHDRDVYLLLATVSKELFQLALSPAMKLAFINKFDFTYETDGLISTGRRCVCGKQWGTWRQGCPSGEWFFTTEYIHGVRMPVFFTYNLFKPDMVFDNVEQEWLLTQGPCSVKLDLIDETDMDGDLLLQITIRSPGFDVRSNNIAFNESLPYDPFHNDGNYAIVKAVPLTEFSDHPLDEINRYLLNRGSYEDIPDWVASITQYRLGNIVHTITFYDNIQNQIKACKEAGTFRKHLFPMLWNDEQRMLCELTMVHAEHPNVNGEIFHKFHYDKSHTIEVITDSQHNVRQFDETDFWDEGLHMYWWKNGRLRLFYRIFKEHEWGKCQSRSKDGLVVNKWRNGDHGRLSDTSTTLDEPVASKYCFFKLNNIIAFMHRYFGLSK